MDFRHDRFCKYDELTEILKQCCGEYSHLLSLELIGKSHEGRDIWVVTATNTKTGVAADIPVYWIDANNHASALIAAQ